MIEIKLIKKLDLQDYTMVEGFPGVGLVGPMSISYMIDKLKMKYVGYLEGTSFPPLVSIHKSEPMPSIRVYCSEEEKLLTIFAEFAIPIELIKELSNAVYDFVKKNKMSKIYSIGGIPMPEGQAAGKVAFTSASKPALLSVAQKAGLKPIEEGVSTGVSALLLLRSTLEKMDDINVMVPVQQNILDPVYAEVAIQCLNKLLKLDIDISDLDKEAKTVEAKIKELVEKHKETHENYKKTVGGSGPSMYA